MKVYGLTGGIGMGKSAAASLLSSQGIPVIDTDDLARTVVEPGQPGLQELVSAFGRQVLLPNGALSREVLAQIVFQNPSARRQLEEILHPRIRQLWRFQVDEWREQGRAIGVVVIPLLFETKAEAELDVTICVACSAASQLERLVRRGWTPEQIQQRVAAQWPIEQKMSLADFVIWTEGRLDVTAAQLGRVLSR
jgi:dephospho-CoA kinase